MKQLTDYEQMLANHYKRQGTACKSTTWFNFGLPQWLWKYSSTSINFAHMIIPIFDHLHEYKVFAELERDM